MRSQRTQGRMVMDEDDDLNSKGIGLLARVGGVILPLAAEFGVFMNVEPDAPLPRVWLVVLRVFGFLWGWPFSGYLRLSLTYGAMGAVTLVFLAWLAVRRDPRGFFAVLGWTLFWGWFLAMETHWTD